MGRGFLYAMRDQDLPDLYRRYGGAIYARCRRILGGGADAEDATQETFLRVWRHLARAPDGQDALRWIYRIATNYCLNEVRDRRHRAEPRDVLPEVGDAPLDQQLADRDLVSRLIARAPAKLRTVAWLYHVDGMDQAEVAGVLGISRRSVVNHLAAFTERAHKFARRAAA